MAFVLNDRVLEISTSTGTGPLALEGAPSGYQTFLSGIGSSNTTYYAVFNTTANEWELGLGTLNAGATTLTRTTIYSSSNANNAVNFSAGTKNVFVTLPASQTVSGASATITGGSINNTPIGQSTAAAGSFTTLSASSTVSGTGFSNYLASPPAIGSVTPATGAFTNLSSSGVVSGVGFSNYLASPPAIGDSTPAAGSFTNLSSSGTVSGTGFSNYLASPPAIGGSAPAAGSFTNLSSSGTVSGLGFTNYLASPPAIGGSTPAAGTFTTLNDSIGNVRDIPPNPQTGAYVLVGTDDGKHISITTGGVTVPSGVFSTGNVVSIYNNSASNQTITQGAGVTLRFAGSTNTGNRTLAAYGLATLLCVGTNTFVISGAGLT